MVTGGEGPPQLSGDIAVIKLFEIADRLADMAAQGVYKSKKYAVGTEWVSLIGGWKSCDIFNDGPDDIYIRFDDISTLPWEEGEAPLKINEHVKVDLVARGYKEVATEGPMGIQVLPVKSGSPVIYLICQSGSANTRVFQLF